MCGDGGGSACVCVYVCVCAGKSLECDMISQV